MAVPNIEIRGLTSLRRKIDQLSGGFSNPKLMAEIGVFLMFNIKERTAAGKDADNVPFIPYTPAYKLFKQSKGHPTDKVNLFFSGSMLSSMTSEHTADRVRLYFTNTSDKTGVKNPLKAFFLNEKREFFAVSKEDRRKIAQMVNSYIGDLLR